MGTVPATIVRSFTHAAEVVHASTLQGWVGFTPCLPARHYDAMLEVYGRKEGNTTWLCFEDDEHKITSLLLLAAIVEEKE